MMNKLKKTYIDLSIQVKMVLWFTVSSVIQKGISMITVPIFTRLMTTAQYGQFSLFTSWQNIIVIFTALNLASGVFNNAMVKYPDKRDSFVSSIQGLIVCNTTVFFVLYLLLHDILNRFTGLSTTISIAIFIELYFSPAISLWTAKKRYEYQYKSVVCMSLALAIANPVVGVLAVLVSTDKTLARIFSIVAVQVAFGIVTIYINQKKGQQFYNKEFWKFALAFNIPLIPHYLSSSLLSQSDRIMIGNFCGDSAAGIYSVAYTMGFVLQIIINSVNSAFTPWFYEQMAVRDCKSIKKITNYLVLICAVVSLITVFLAPEAMKILASKEYYEGIYCIPPIALSVLFIFLYDIFANVEFFFGANKFISFATMCSAGLNIVLNYIFIPHFGYPAAAYTTLACYILQAVAHCIFMCCILKKENIENCYNIKTIILISALTIAVGLSMLPIYDLLIIRFGILLVICVIVVVKRNSIISVLKTLKKKS